jgi:hypothetical protein
LVVQDHQEDWNPRLNAIPQTEWQAAVKLPEARKARTAMAIGIAATATLVIVGPGSTAATAGRMITGAAIKNNTIRSVDLRDNGVRSVDIVESTVRSRDIRNGTVRGRDVRNGSLTAADFSGSMRGARGPVGATGPRGAVGPAGPPGTPGTGGGGQESVAVWNVHHDSANDVFSPAYTSSDTVPAGTQVEVVKLTITSGGFESCTSGTVAVRLEGNNQSVGSTAKEQGQPWTAALPGGGVTGSEPSPILLQAVCRSEFGAQQSVPEFDAAVTLAFTERSTTPNSAFN